MTKQKRKYFTLEQDFSVEPLLKKSKQQYSYFSPKIIVPQTPCTALVVYGHFHTKLRTPNDLMDIETC